MLDHPKIINVVLIIGVILLVSFAVYFNLKKTPENNNIVNQNNSTSTENTIKLSRIYYKNSDYGFVINLPNSWEGYSVIEDEWEGSAVNNTPDQSEPTEHGPLVSVRHPDWEYKSPRQDIPIMVFTLKQWSDLTFDKFHVGSAPINPSEIGRNAKYVFAIPARYNYGFLVGYEEVDLILRGDSVKAF